MTRMFLVGALLGSLLGGAYVTKYGDWGFLVCVVPALGLLIALGYMAGVSDAKSESEAERETERS